MSPIKLSILDEIAKLSDSATGVEKLFDWHFERHKLLFQLTAAFLGAFFAGVVVAALKGDYANNWLIVTIVLSFATLGTGSLMARSYLAMSRIDSEFVAALKLVTLIRSS